AVVAFAVLGAYTLGGKALGRLPVPEARRKELARSLAIILVAAAVASLGFLTIRRNVDYQSEIVMWTDVVKKQPANARGHNNLGMLLAERGRLEEAAAHFAEACRRNPAFADAHNNMGLALTMLGNAQEGKAYLVKALMLRPDYADAHCNLGRNLIAQGEFDEAVYHLSRALQIDGSYGEAYFYMGLAQEKQGKIAEAIKNFNQALRLRPNWVEALGHVALVLATQQDSRYRNPDEAVRHAERAVYLTSGQDIASLETLAAAYAEAGRHSRAVEAAQIAMEMAAASGDTARSSSIGARLERYRSAGK
ncbi:MAG TPA: tetratricopeptide repeat protein, partial [Blastocatellia bacterium]|nr:tetratricopeptide repeat protein [Blastocatellia bacterium]